MGEVSDARDQGRPHRARAAVGNAASSLWEVILWARSLAVVATALVGDLAALAADRLRRTAGSSRPASVDDGGPSARFVLRRPGRRSDTAGGSPPTLR